jgi:hypothetical protein
MMILIPGLGRRRSLQRFSMDVIGGCVSRLHSRRGIFTVIGPSPWPTKTIRGALAFFRGASCSIKTRDPIKQDRIIDFATAQ